MKKAIVFIVAITLTLALAGCGEIKTGNRVTAGKDVQTFTYAYIRVGDRDIDEGFVTQWRDYTDSDVVQVLMNGKYYLTHYSCVVLVADPSQGALQYGNPDAMYGTDE